MYHQFFIICVILYYCPVKTTTIYKLLLPSVVRLALYAYRLLSFFNLRCLQNPNKDDQLTMKLNSENYFVILCRKQTLYLFPFLTGEKRNCAYNIIIRCSVSRLKVRIKMKRFNKIAIGYYNIIICLLLFHKR